MFGLRNSLIIAALALPLSAFAAPSRCYQLSDSPNAWSRSGSYLCISDETEATITHGFPPSVSDHFVVRLAARARCFDCNKDVYEIVEAKKNTISLENREIRFEGTRDMDRGESGTVSVGGNAFYYMKGTE